MKFKFERIVWKSLTSSCGVSPLPANCLTESDQDTSPASGGVEKGGEGAQIEKRRRKI